MSSDVLQVSPIELKFKFELRKNIPVILTLTNPSTDRVAFKVKTTSPKTYCVRPSSGFVEPNSIMQVQIIRQAQREYPASYGDTKDKFLVQSTKAGPDASDLNTDLFDLAKNPALQQTKLRVALVGPPQPPSPVPEHPETGDDDLAPTPQTFKEATGITSRDVGGPPSADVFGQYKEKAERAERENADLRRKLVVRGQSGGGLTILHLVLVAIISFLIGHFLK